MRSARSRRTLVAADVVRGQYSRRRGRRQAGARLPRGAHRRARRPTTETYVALKLLIDNWRWADVPFYLRTGKRLARRVSEIAIRFKSPPLLLFQEAHCADQVVPNTLIVRIQPDEGIALRFQAKVPGPDLSVGLVRMDFKYADYFGAEPSTGYETLLYDVMTGDPSLFHRADMVETGWEVVAPLLEAWARTPDGVEPVPGVVVGTAVGADAARARRAGVADAVSEEAAPGRATRRRRRGCRRADGRRRGPPPPRHRRGDRRARRLLDRARRRPHAACGLRAARRSRHADDRLDACPRGVRRRARRAARSRRQQLRDGEGRALDRVPLPASANPSHRGRAAADVGRRRRCLRRGPVAGVRARARCLAGPGSRAPGRRPRRPHRVAVPAHAGAGCRPIGWRPR